MRTYVLQRVLLMVPQLVGVSILVFALVRVIPGDVALLMVAGGQGGDAPAGSAATIQAIRQSLDLDKPIHEQYGIWLAKVARGDLGASYWTKRPIVEEIARALPVTIELAVLSLAISILIGLPIGIVAAVRQDTAADYVGRLFSIGALSLPEFWIGTMLILLPLLWFGWIPTIKYTPLLVDPWANLQQVLFPAVALGLHNSGPIMRIVRSSMLEVLRQDYVRTAWAKGLRESAVVSRHALKNAAIPVLSLIGVRLGRLLGGTVVMEQIFVVPGMGLLVLSAISERDYPLLQALIILFAAIFLVVNLIVDVLYAWLDPRIRYA
jgi:peptide/nickel transport system permease protein